MAAAVTFTKEDSKIEEILKALAEPFPDGEISFKPGVVKGNRALALAYIDSRNVQDRLDKVLGAHNWQDSYELVGEHSVMCRLSLRIGGEWITKMDVGSTSDQPYAGDRVKAATSDAIKRAAVKWGIGRFLYSLPQQWFDYDPQKRQWVGAGPKLAKSVGRRTTSQTFEKCREAIARAATEAILITYRTNYKKRTQDLTADEITMLDGFYLQRLEVVLGHAAPNGAVKATA